MIGLLGRLALDFSPLRESGQFRVLVAGQLISDLGTQVALVALPYQVFVLSRSATLVGLLGAFELGPMVVVSLFGGALADRTDRRYVLVAAQFGVAACAAVLAAIALAGRPPVVAVLVLGGLLAGSGALNSLVRAAIVPGVVSAAGLPSALALDFGILQAAGIVGPAAGGVLIAALGVGPVYLIDAVSCAAMVAAALALGPQAPRDDAKPVPVLGAIAEGLRFVRNNNALAGSFAIDLVATTFGWPRALFAVLALTVYDAGATGTGLLYTALSAGALLAILTAGWLGHTRRLGRVVLGAVVCWGAAIAGAGLVRSLGPALALFTVAGYADGVSSVCRSTINQTVTPDNLRGRMSSLYVLVINSGPRLGDIESGLVAGATSATIALLSGGLACIAGVGAILRIFPGLSSYRRTVRPPSSKGDANEPAAARAAEVNIDGGTSRGGYQPTPPE